MALSAALIADPRSNQALTQATAEVDGVGLKVADMSAASSDRQILANAVLRVHVFVLSQPGPSHTGNSVQRSKAAFLSPADLDF